MSHYAAADTPKAKAVLQSAPEMLLEKIEGTLPSQLGRSLVIPRGRVVVETMIDPLVNIGGVGQLICHGSAKAETNDADFTRAFGTRSQPGNRGHKIFEHFVLVHLGKKLRPF